MRKICFIMIAVLLACLCLSCDPEGGTARNLPEYLKKDYQFELGRFAGLDEDTEWQIVQAYLQKLKSDGEHGDITINDVWIEQYYGAYFPVNTYWEQEMDGKTWYEYFYAPENQTVFAVMMGNKDQENSTEQQEVSIRYSRGRAFVKDGSRIFLWYDEQLYDFDYSSELLVNWDFLRIANLQNGLDTETQSKIQEDWGKSINWSPEYYNEIPLHYLGAYNDYIVLISHTGTNASVFHLIIDNVHFFSPSSSSRLFAWKEGEIYTLQELYKQGLITREDLVKMAYNLHAPPEEFEIEEATTAGRLTITGLSAYEGEYIRTLHGWDMILEGLEGATNVYDTKCDTSLPGEQYSGRVSSGQAVLKVFVQEPQSSGKGGGYQNYTGNDQKVGFMVLIGELYLGRATVNFTDGVGSGVFVPFE